MLKMTCFILPKFLIDLQLFFSLQNAQYLSLVASWNQGKNFHLRCSTYQDMLLKNVPLSVVVSGRSNLITRNISIQIILFLPYLLERRSAKIQPYPHNLLLLLFSPCMVKYPRVKSSKLLQWDLGIKKLMWDYGLRIRCASSDTLLNILKLVAGITILSCHKGSFF